MSAGEEPTLRDLRMDGMSDEEHTRRMRAARAVALWQLGDASWAGTIVGAFMSPDEALAGLEGDAGDELPRMLRHIDQRYGT